MNKPKLEWMTVDEFRLKGGKVRNNGTEVVHPSRKFKVVFDEVEDQGYMWMILNSTQDKKTKEHRAKYTAPAVRIKFR